MSSASDDLQLLSSAVTPFVELSLFFFKSNDEQAVKARQKWSARKPFYAYLYQEILELKELLETSNETFKVTPNGRKAVASVLEHFERNSSRSLVQGQGVAAANRTYSKLRALLQIDDLNLTVLQRRIHLKHNTEDEFRRMVGSLKECKKQLGKNTNQKRRYGLVTDQVPVSNKPSVKRQKQFPAQVIRVHANSTHNLLVRNWNCSCENLPCIYTTTKLQLAVHLGKCTHENVQCDCKLTQFDLLFGSGNESWQQGEIQVVNKRRIVGFSDQTRSQVPEDTGKQRSWSPVESVCDLIRKSVTNKRHITFRLKDGSLWFNQSTIIASQEDSQDSSLQLSKSLQDFISGQGTLFPFRDVKRRERFALSVLLANALLHFYDGPWCLQSWDPKEIHFYQDDERRNVPEFRKPYLSTTCSHIESTAAPSKANKWEHPYPTLLSFGCLLIGMELGRSININNLQEALAEVQEVKEDGLAQSFEPYFEAIEACIDIGTFKRGWSFQDEEFTNQVWQNVVCPLEKALYQSFPDMAGKLSSPTKLSDVIFARTISLLDNGAPIQRRASLSEDKGVQNLEMKSITGKPPQSSMSAEVDFRPAAAPLMDIIAVKAPETTFSQMRMSGDSRNHIGAHHGNIVNGNIQNFYIGLSVEGAHTTGISPPPSTKPGAKLIDHKVLSSLEDTGKIY